MDRQKLETRIAEALDKHAFGSLGTVERDKPKVRYMALFHEGLNVYLATDRKTHKVEELERNPHAYLLFGYEGGGPKEVVEIEGTASVSGDDGLRRQIWRDEMKKWFNGPDDPDYVVLNLAPTRIEYTGEDRERRIWEK